jgi:yeast amino acid transporter
MGEEINPKDHHGLKGKESNPEFNLADPRKQLERGLKSRHIQFLALGMALILTFEYQH